MRVCPPTLKAHFDLLIPKEVRSPRDLLQIVAHSCVGVTEVGGDNKGPLVELFQSAVSRPAGQSWCLDFLQACIAYVEVETGALSPLPATELCMDLWNRSKVIMGTDTPWPGDIVIWQLGETIHGHTGLIVGMDSLRFQTVEGNTSPAAGIERNGDGVFLKNRAKGGSKTFKEVGFLRVFA